MKDCQALTVTSARKACEQSAEVRVDLLDQRVLAGEAPVYHADPHAGPRGDLLHGGVGSGFAQHVPRSLKDSVMVAHGIAPPRSSRAIGSSSLRLGGFALKFCAKAGPEVAKSTRKKTNVLILNNFLFLVAVKA